MPPCSSGIFIFIFHCTSFCIILLGIHYHKWRAHDIYSQQNPCLHFYNLSEASGKILDIVKKMHLQYGLPILAFEKEKEGEISKNNFLNIPPFFDLFLSHLHATFLSAHSLLHSTLDTCHMGYIWHSYRHLIIRERSAQLNQPWYQYNIERIQSCARVVR